MKYVIYISVSITILGYIFFSCNLRPDDKLYDAVHEKCEEIRRLPDGGIDIFREQQQLYDTFTDKEKAEFGLYLFDLYANDLKEPDAERYIDFSLFYYQSQKNIWN